MAVSVVQHSQAYLDVPPLTVAPQAGDLLVLVAAHYRGAGRRTLNSVTGLGATWTPRHGWNDPRATLEIWTCQPAATGAITVSWSGGAQASYAVLLIRGLNNPTATSTFTTDGSTTTGVMTPAAQPAGPGQAVLLLGMTGFPDLPFVLEPVTPTTAWTILPTTTSAVPIGSGYRLPAASASHQGRATGMPDGTSAAAALLVLGEAEGGGEPEPVTLAATLAVTPSGSLDGTDTPPPAAATVAATLTATPVGALLGRACLPVEAILTVTPSGALSSLSEGNLSATLTATPSGSLVGTDGTGRYVTARLTITPTGTLDAEVRATVDATLTVVPTGSLWGQREWVRDPITGRGAYQLAVTDRAGTVLATLSTSYLTRPIVDRLNDVDGTGSGTGFDVPGQIASQYLRQYRELTVARGGHHLGTYVLLNPDDQATNGKVSWQAAGLGHYFTKRRVGPARRQSLLTGAWRGGYREGSIPATPPKFSRVTEPAQVGPSLRVEGSTHVQQTVTRLGSDTTFAPGSWTLSASGKDAIRAFAKEVEVDRDATDLVDIEPPVITIEGHTDSVPDYGPGGNQGLSERRAKAVHDFLAPLVPEGTTLRWVGYGETRPLVRNRPGGTVENRRVDIIYPKTVSARGHRQYVEKRITYTNPSAHITRNLTFVSWWSLESYKEPNADASIIWVGRRPLGGDDNAWVEYDTAEVHEETPLNTWTRSEATITVPADGQAWEIVARLTPPAGTVVYDEGATHLWADDALEFIDVDQADIVAALVAHAQDAAFDKDDLGITVRATKTGIKRKRVYYWHERQTIAECLEELLNISDGLEVTWETTPTSRTLVTHYPRAGQVTAATLYGDPTVKRDPARVVDDFRISLNGASAATTVIIQADGQGPDREEGVVTGVPADLDLVLEDVWTAEPGTHIGELVAQAQRGHRHHAGHVPVVSATVRQELTDEWLDRVSLGDTVGTNLRGRTKHVTGPHRVTARSLDPIADRVIYSPTVEV